MKAFFRLFLISIIFFTCGKVLAFNTETINLSDDINVLYYDSDNIKIKISDGLKDVNSEIYYQFISASAEEVDSFENKNNKAYDNLANCIEGESEEKCINDYNLEKDNILSTVPNFDTNWNKISGSGSIYSIPKFNDNYFLWVKAKDLKGNDIYSLFYESSSFDNNAIVGSVKSSYERDINSSIAMASMMLSVIGMICFIVSIIYIIRYSYIKKELV
ncbi:MAG: hypothetical protein IKE90_00630 [Bacilli bacterium]|nr:hypothetical protein [Bacilli bacterium]